MVYTSRMSWAIQGARWGGAVLVKLLQFLLAWVFIFAFLSWAFSRNFVPDNLSQLLPRPVFQSDNGVFNAIWFFGSCFGACGGVLVWLGFEPFTPLPRPLRNQGSRVPGFLSVAAYFFLVFCFVLARTQHSIGALVVGVLAVGLRLLAMGLSLGWMLAAAPVVYGIVALVASHDGRLPYAELNEKEQEKRQEELTQIMTAREEGQRARDKRVRELLDSLYTQLNAGAFNAKEYFQPNVERFAQLTNTSPSEINAKVGGILIDAFPGCSFSYEKPSLKAENAVQYAYVETVACPVQGKPKVRQRSLVRVRIPFEGGKLTLYLPVRPLPAIAPPAKSAG